VSEGSLSFSKDLAVSAYPVSNKPDPHIHTVLFRTHINRILISPTKEG
jgi:hypothetical protein